MKDKSHEMHIPLAGIRIGRYTFLLICILMLFVARPLLEDFVNLNLLLDIFLTGLLLSGIYALRIKHTVLIIGLALVTPALVTEWWPHVVRSKQIFFLGGPVFGALFFGLSTVMIVRNLFHEHQVDADLIMGGICGYFLTGVFWGLIFFVVENLAPASFTIAALDKESISDFVYYSFVTLTTLGYGDITPLSSLARNLAVLTAVSGQLYLAIFVAGLVGSYVSQGGAKGRRSKA